MGAAAANGGQHRGPGRCHGPLGHDEVEVVAVLGVVEEREAEEGELEDVEERTHGAGGLGGPPPARWPVLSSRSAAEAVRLRQIETCGDERVTDPLLIFCYFNNFTY